MKCIILIFCCFFMVVMNVVASNKTSTPSTAAAVACNRTVTPATATAVNAISNTTAKIPFDKGLGNMITVPPNCPVGQKADASGVCREVF